MSPRNRQSGDPGEPGNRDNQPHGRGSTYVDKDAARIFNRNCEALYKAVEDKRANAITGWWGHVAHEIELRTGLRITLETVRGWLNGKGTKGCPNHTLMPTIVDIYNEALDVKPPMTMEDLYRPNILERIAGRSNTVLEVDGLHITIEDYDEFGPVEYQLVEEIAGPLLTGQLPAATSGRAAVSSKDLREFIEKRHWGIRFMDVDFGRAPGKTCPVTSEIETALNRVLKSRGIEARVAPAVGNIRTPVGGLSEDDLQRLRITLMGRYCYQYVMHLLQERRKVRHPSYLAVAGGVHLGKFVRHFEPEDVALIDGVMPLSLTQTEQLRGGYAPADLQADVLDPPGLRANELVQIFADLAERIGHTHFLKRLPTWYGPEDVRRDQLFPPALRKEYFEETREAIRNELAGNPALIEVAIAKLDSLELYFDTTDLATISVMSLGHLKPRNDPFGATAQDGLVGNVLFRPLKPDGSQAQEHQDLHDVVLGPPLEWLKTRSETGNLNAVTFVTGSVKLHILLATIRGGYCKTILLDAHLAQLLYEELLREDGGEVAA